jgi:acyl-CoA thioester hydrolase
VQYTTRHEVRYSDADRFGHVNHLRLLEFFESSRNPFFNDLAAADGQPCLLDTQGFMVAHLVADFHAAIPATARTIEVRTAITRLGASSLTLRYELWYEQTCIVTASTVLVFVRDGTKEPISDSQREFFSTYVLPPSEGGV